MKQRNSKDIFKFVSPILCIASAINYVFLAIAIFVHLLFLAIVLFADMKKDRRARVVKLIKDVGSCLLLLVIVSVFVYGCIFTTIPRFRREKHNVDMVWSQAYSEADETTLVNIDFNIKNRCDIAIRETVLTLELYSLSGEQTSYTMSSKQVIEALTCEKITFSIAESSEEIIDVKITSKKYILSKTLVQKISDKWRAGDIVYRIYYISCDVATAMMVLVWILGFLYLAVDWVLEKTKSK